MEKENGNLCHVQIMVGGRSWWEFMLSVSLNWGQMNFRMFLSCSPFEHEASAFLFLFFRFCF